jgi:hypothetical protein
MVTTKALISINGQLVSPLDIKSITMHKGNRCSWSSWDNQKLWHPAITKYIDELPWWKRVWVRSSYSVCEYYSAAHVTIKLSGNYQRIGVSFSNNVLAQQYANLMIKKWDDGLAKFHGDIK